MVGGRKVFRALDSFAKKKVMKGARRLQAAGATAGSAETTTERSGFVYVITNEAWPDYVKIGRAFDPEARLRGYQTSCPLRDFKLYAAIYFEDCHFAEAEIHARLDDEHRQGALGEWFKITPFLARHNIHKLRSIL